jgi:hypothetical protein
MMHGTRRDRHTEADNVSDPTSLSQQLPPTAAPIADPDAEHDDQHLEPLSIAIRLVLWILGILLLILGVIGLALPVLQGVLFLVLGSALLSVASHGFFKLLKQRLHRWPRIADSVHRARVRMHRRLGGRQATRIRTEGQDSSNRPPEDAK